MDSSGKHDLPAQDQGSKQDRPCASSTADARSQPAPTWVIRLLFAYCASAQVLSIRVACKIHQDGDSWNRQSRKSKVQLAWGTVCAVCLVVFTAGYVAWEWSMWRECRARQLDRDGKRFRLERDSVSPI